MSIRDFITLDDQRYPVKAYSLRRGPAMPFVPRFAPGSKAFTGGTPPFDAIGQRRFSGGFQQKYAPLEDNGGWMSSFNWDSQWHDRLVFAKSWASPTTKSSKAEIRFARLPFKDILVAYTPGSKNVYTKTGTAAWADASLPGTAYTGFLCDTIAKIASTVYLLLGTLDGYVVAFDGTNWTEVGRPSSGGDNFNSGIYCMTSFNNTLYLGGQNAADSQAIMATYDGTTMTVKFKGYDVKGASTIATMIRRFVDSDQTPNQLHFTTRNTGHGNYGFHFMYDGVELHELFYWADNAPISVVEFGTTGSKALYFGMARLGSVWRFTGDYVEVLRLDTPDTPYSYGVRSLAQSGKFLILPMLDAVNGLSLIRYDGEGWWQCEAIGTGTTGYAGEGASVAVYNETIFLSLMATASALFELNTGANLPTQARLVTSLLDADYREVPKEWLRARITHAPLLTGESLELSYALDATLGKLAFSEGFFHETFFDRHSSDGIWDVDNHYATVPGLGINSFSGKLTGSLHENPHVAYSSTGLSGVVSSLGTELAAATEFGQSDYTNIATDDLNRADTQATALLTRPYHLFGFDLSQYHSISTIAMTYKGYSTNTGVEMYIWNHLDGAWESLGSNSATSDVGSTITASISTHAERYLDHNSVVWMVAQARGVAFFGIPVDLLTNYIKLDANWDTTARTVRTLPIVLGHGNITKATLRPTTSGGSSYTYYMSVVDGDVPSWESVTANVEKTFAGTGGTLRWRADIQGTASSPPTITKVDIDYTMDAAAIWKTLGTNAVIGSAESVFVFPDGVYSKLLSLRLTGNGGGSTAPTVFDWTAEYLVSPDTIEEYRLELNLHPYYRYDDGVADTRTAAQMYADILALKRGRRKPSFTWVDGTEISQVTFKDPFWALVQRGVGSDAIVESDIILPISFIEVQA